MTRRERAEAARHDARYRAMLAAVEAFFGDAVMSARCGTDLAGFADRCTADLDDACEGYRRLDEVRGRKVREMLEQYTTARVPAHAGTDAPEEGTP